MPNKFFVRSFLSLFLIVSLSLVNVTTALADDPTPPPATAEPTEEPAQPTDEPTPAPDETPSSEEQVPAGEEAPAPTLFSQVPEDTVIVVLDESGNPIPVVSQEALEVILEDDPMWCPGTLPPGSPGCRNFTGANGITNLLTDMRNNTGAYDENGTIYFTADPGNGAFTLTDAGTSLGAGDFNTLRNYNIILQGGWNGSTFNPQYNTQTNFGSDYFHIGTAANPWVGSVTVRNITVDGVTSNLNPSMAVYTTTGTVTMTNILVDDADNQESIRVTTNSGNINLTNVDVTDGDDDYAVNITTNSGSVTLTDVLVDDHTDADAINITAGTGNVTLNNTDVTGGSNGDGINVTTTSGVVNMTGVDVDGQTGGNGINVTTNSGNINFNDTDVSNHQGGYTANLSSQNGNINVTNNSDFEGDNTNHGFYASTTNGSITITGTSANRIDFTDAEGPGTGTNYNAATLNAPNVTLSYVTATDSDGNGILINATTSVTLNNVIADNNGTNPSGAGNSIGSGVRIVGDGSTVVNVTGGTFTNNDRYGIEVIDGTLNFTTMPTFGNNVLGPYFPGGQDTTGPVITPNVSCVGGAGWGNAGWCRGTVLISWNVVDAESPVSSETGCDGPFFGYYIVNNNTPSTGQTFTCSATSADGTLSSTRSVTVHRDVTAPTVSATSSPAPNANGWNNTDVTVTFSGTDANSGVASCTAPIVRSADGAGQSATGNCTDVAGNVSSNVTVSNINIDKTPPTITLVSRTPANGNGWNTGSVTATWSCYDALSGVVSATVSQTVSTEGANQTATGTCQDRAGNSSSSTENGINIDWTPPVLTVPANMTVEATGPSGAPVTFSATATDVLDGAPGIVCTPASGGVFTFGTTPVTCTATDLAGNSSSGNFSITVQDTTPPVIAQPADILSSIQNIFGSKKINYPLPVTTDVVDGNGTATCTPPSGSSFKVGETLVTCTAVDTHGNAAVPVTFTVRIQLDTSNQTSTIISAKSNETIDLDCNTQVLILGIKVIFYNLCDQQAILGAVDINSLPGDIPAGLTFVTGLTVNILDQGRTLDLLPTGTGVEMDFPASGTDGFAVLFWDNGQWVEVTQALNEGDINKALTEDSPNELYKIVSTEKGVHKVLTAENTGTFVLVKK